MSLLKMTLKVARKISEKCEIPNKLNKIISLFEGQRRKEHLQARVILKNQTTATRLNSPKVAPSQPSSVTTTTTRLTSPRTSQQQQQQQPNTTLTSAATASSNTALKIDVSPNIGLQHHLNSNYSSSNNASSTPNTNGFVLPSNRAPAQSPIQSPSPYFPMPVLNQSATVTTQVNYPNSNNNNSSLSTPSATPVSVNSGNYAHLKHTENNYREFQKRKNEASTNGTPISTITLPLFNMFEKSRPTNGTTTTAMVIKTNEAALNTGINNDSPANDASNGAVYKKTNVNFTKIPLSPKSKNLFVYLMFVRFVN